MINSKEAITRSNISPSNIFLNFIRLTKYLSRKKKAIIIIKLKKKSGNIIAEKSFLRNKFIIAIKFKNINIGTTNKKGVFNNPCIIASI